MDLNKLMKQAQAMQAKVAKAQAELENKEVTGQAGGGQVTVVMNGRHRVKSVTIAPEAVDPDDVEFLQDLVASALNDAAAAVDAMVEKEMGAATGGMGLNLPGLG